MFTSTAVPKYDLVKKHGEKGKEYEERRYNAGKWIVTKVTGKSFKEGSDEGFIRLFKYIGGENKEGKRVSMTAPVVLFTRPADDNWSKCADEVMVGYFVPVDTKDLPTPKTDDITFRDSPEHTVYVRVFGGFAKEEDYITNINILRNSINDSDSYHSNFFYACGYDSPMKLISRRNEVWLIKK
ncbi:heme-binding protein 1-like isoform X2 [Antedon mediterranea]